MSQTVVTAGTSGSLDVRNVTVKAGGLRILSQIGLSLFPGELCAVLGPSGAGKSTLIKVLLDIREPDEGTVLIGGQPVKESGPVGYVPQDDALHRDLTVWRELDYAVQLRLPSLSPAEREEKILRATHAVGLEERKKTRIRSLSGGQRKRVSVALELLTSPHLLILDEPTSGLDPGLEAKMMTLFAKIASEGRIVLVATHAMESIERCQALILIVQGHLAFFGEPLDALQYFDVERYVDIFTKLDQRSPQEWQSSYFNHPARMSFAERPAPGPSSNIEAADPAPEPIVAKPTGQEAFDGQAALAALKEKMKQKEE